MEKFDYKVLWYKTHAFRGGWFDGEKDLGPEITTELLAGYGDEGWEVVATMVALGGVTNKIILKRGKG